MPALIWTSVRFSRKSMASYQELVSDLQWIFERPKRWVINYGTVIRRSLECTCRLIRMNSYIHHGASFPLQILPFVFHVSISGTRCWDGGCISFSFLFLFYKSQEHRPIRIHHRCDGEDFLQRRPCIQTEWTNQSINRRNRSSIRFLSVCIRIIIANYPPLG